MFGIFRYFPIVLIIFLSSTAIAETRDKVAEKFSRQWLAMMNVNVSISQLYDEVFSSKAHSRFPKQRAELIFSLFRYWTISE